MAIHRINAKLPAMDVANVDVTFVVHRDNAKLGELHVSKGSIDWKPAHARIAIKKRWVKFDELMSNS
jgi:hypothetical protein